MARPVTEKQTIEKNTILDMQSLNVYKKEYGPLIKVYSDLFSQYIKLNREYEEDGMKYNSYTAAGGEKRSAISSTLDSLRKDILAYSDRLCLNPRSLNVEPPKPIEQSILTQFIEQQKK